MTGLPQCLAVGALLSAASLIGVEAAAAEAATTDRRPNILFCLADDWSWPHAGVYGDAVVKTPTFDRLAAEGVLFANAFCGAPSCTPSRATILTGQWAHRLGPGADQSGILPREHRVYPDALEESGYWVGYMGKPWAPGDVKRSHRTRNPAGPGFKSLAAFLEQAPPGKPFCFWFGSHDPHRPYKPGTGAALARWNNIPMPAHLPDTPVVRKDLLDYYFEVQRFDRDLGEMLDLLKQRGQIDNTLVVVSSDNGMPFPRSKATSYDTGLHVPLAICWPARIPGGRRVDDFVSLTDLAPTFLEAARVNPWKEITGRSLWPVLTSNKHGQVDLLRDKVFLERERHGYCREDGQSYPVRAVRTREFLYLRNLRPELLPAGDPAYITTIGPYGDLDPGPSKDELLSRKDDPAIAPFFARACDRRPAEELYDLANDPSQLHNVAGQGAYDAQQKRLRGELDRWMAESGDPRAKGETDIFDKAPFFGAPSTVDGKPVVRDGMNAKRGNKHLKEDK